MKLKDALKEDMGKFSKVEVLNMLHNFLIKSKDSLDRYDIFKLCLILRKRNISLFSEIEELVGLGELEDLHI